MKRLMMILLCFLTVFLMAGCQTVTSTPPSSEMESTVSEITSSEPESKPEQSELEEEESAVTSEPEVTPQSLLAQMTLEEKVYQLFFVRPETLVGKNFEYEQITLADEALLASLTETPVCGVALFGGNIILPGQTKKLISDLQQSSRIPLFVGVDEEGGMVARLGNNPDMGTTSFPSMMTIGKTGNPDEAYRVGYTIGSELLPFGFNLDFAPVADVATNPQNSVIGSRAFSSDAYVAADMVSHAVRGFSDAGIISVLKHFPGHGDTAEDSHTELAVNHKTYAELTSCEWVPFSAGIQSGADMVMIGHIMVPNADDSGLPATFSSYLLQDVLRGDLGFEGVIITDSMEMEAIAADYPPDVSSVLALQAGVDIIVLPTDLKLAANGVLAAVEQGRLTEERIDESVLRILTLKDKYGLLP